MSDLQNVIDNLTNYRDSLISQIGNNPDTIINNIDLLTNLQVLLDSFNFNNTPDPEPEPEPDPPKTPVSKYFIAKNSGTIPAGARTVYITLLDGTATITIGGGTKLLTEVGDGIDIEYAGDEGHGEISYDATNGILEILETRVV